MKCSFSPYGGRDPFIFISYSHANEDIIKPILENLYSYGFRIWYDDGIAGSMEWNDIIAHKIEQCDICITFLSGTFINSKYCKRELLYADSCNKPILPIYLENISLDGALALNLTQIQSFFLNDYQTLDKLIEKIVTTDALKRSLDSHRHTIFINNKHALESQASVQFAKQPLVTLNAMEDFYQIGRDYFINQDYENAKQNFHKLVEFCNDELNKMNHSKVATFH